MTQINPENPVVAPTADPVDPALGFNPAELAAVEAGRRGFATPEPAAPSDGPQRPEWCPEQFWKDGAVDQEGLAKSYSSIRSKMDGKPDPAAAAAPAADAAARPDGKIEPEPAAPETSPLTSAMERAREEWGSTQEVSEETFASLEAAGIPRDITNLYLEGLKAQTQQIVGEIHAIAGGTEKYDAMVGWAAKALSPAEIAAFNDALDNPAAREASILGLQAKFMRANPSEGSLLSSNSGSAISSDVFQNREEFLAAQRDPRYNTNEAYRTSVSEKLARSHSAGFQLVDRPVFGRTVVSS